MLWRTWRRLKGFAPHPMLVDGGLAVALSGAAAAQYVVEHPGSLWKLPFVVGGTLALVLRRRYPMAMVLVQAACLVALQISPPLGDFFAIMISFYSVGAHSKWRLFSLVFIVVGQVALLLAIPEAKPPIPDRLQNLVLVIGIWLVGNAIRALREGMDRAERERRLAAQVAAAEERALIARELHDVVAHGVSVMVVQAGAARQVMAKRPERATEALRTVETTGREALAELRHLLGLLHDDGAEPALTPRGGLDQLDLLVERTRAAGLPVRLSIEGKPRALPAGLDLTAYRIVQEALTNALKYSGMAPTEVVVRYGDGDLVLQVSDEGTESPGGKPGRGLIGMKERARLYGGALEAGPGADGGYVVSARLPTEPS